MRSVLEAADVTAARPPVREVHTPSQQRFWLQRSDVHPVRCDVVVSSSSQQELVESACVHGARAHGFTPVWYSASRVASMAAAVIG
jgi:hypothetical protein